MNHVELASALRAGVGPESVGRAREGGAFPCLEIAGEGLKRVLRFCAFEASIRADFLEDLFACDVEDALTVTYRLYSTEHRHRFHLRARAGRDSPGIPSAADIWGAAADYEREAAEMFGIRFLGHPDPSNLLLAEGWVGYPLRKDYGFPDGFSGIEHGRPQLRKAGGKERERI